MSFSDETCYPKPVEAYDDSFTGALLDSRARGASFLLTASAGQLAGAELGSPFHAMWVDICYLIEQSGATGSEVLRKISQTLEQQGVITIAEVLDSLPHTPKSADLLAKIFSPYQYTNTSE
jgi:hypothetical protein